MLNFIKYIFNVRDTSKNKYNARKTLEVEIPQIENMEDIKNFFGDKSEQYVIDMVNDFIVRQVSLRVYRNARIGMDDDTIKAIAKEYKPTKE